jgi:endoglucanase
MKPKKTKNQYLKNSLFYFLLLTISIFSLTLSANSFSSKDDPSKSSKKKLAATRIVNCNTVDQITAALADARAGDEIIIAPGTYSSSKKTKDGIGKFSYFACLADGTASNPIVLRGANSSSIPILRVIAGSEYSSPVMSITGDHWILKDIELSYGNKGIFLDTANNCQLINVNVKNIGDEGIHFRSGSSNNLLKNCRISNVGVKQPGFGEAIYIGSDQKQHGIYNPSCNNNTVEGCTIGPDVRAEGIDVKEGTLNTIIRNNTFSGSGISGENSADAFVDTKGGLIFIYGNTFNIDGSNVIASGIDFQQRRGDKSGNRIAIFNNTFNLGSKSGVIPTARKKGGDPSEIHVWNNKRNPSSVDFPVSDGSLKFITQSCPSWNIISCSGGSGGGGGGGSTNVAPTVNITSPSNGTTFSTGNNITVEASANDSDGTVSKVEFYNGATKLGEDTSSPYLYTISSAASGSYALSAKATDNKGASSTSRTVNIKVGTVIVPDNCSFGTPTSSALPKVNKSTFANMYVLGAGGPASSNFKKFQINWDLASNNLIQFAYSTKDGIPSFYVDLKGKFSQNFNASNPSISITSSGIAGLDGTYYVTKDADNFVMVSKDKSFTLYFSNSGTAPNCSSSRITKNSDVKIGIIPNPASDIVTFSGILSESKISIVDMQGKIVLEKTLNNRDSAINVSFLNPGVYITTIISQDNVETKLLQINR